MYVLRLTPSWYHVTQRTGVDVGVVDAAVFSISVSPVGRTVQMFTEAPSGLSSGYGAEDTRTRHRDVMT